MEESEYPRPEKSWLPIQCDAWKCANGKRHETYIEAVAANLASLLSGDNANGGGLTPALANLIIKNRAQIMPLLQSVPAEIVAAKIEDAAHD